MATLAEIRQKHPDYDDLTDEQLADRLYQKFYSDVPRAEFDQKIGLSTQAAPEQKSRPFAQAAAGAVEDGAIGSLKALQGAVDLWTGRIAQQAFLPPEFTGGANAIDSKAVLRGMRLPEKAVTPGDGYARTAGAFAANSLLPGSLVQRAVRTAIPAAASEFLGQQFQDTEYEPYARIAGALGGVIPAEAVGSLGTKAIGLVGGARTMPERIQGLWNRAKPSPGQLNSFPAGIQLTSAQDRAANKAASRVSTALASRGGLLKRGGLEEYDKWLAENYEQGVTPFVFQAYGQPGVSKMASLARQPGEAPELAYRKIEGRPPEAPGRRYDLKKRSLAALDKLTGGAKLDDEIRSAQSAFKPILTDDAVTPALEQRVGPILDKIDDADAEEILAEAARLARAEGYKEGLNKAQTLQFQKRALWQFGERLLSRPETVQRGHAYKQIFNELRDVLHGDEGIAGYKAVDSAYEGLMRKKAIDSELRQRIRSTSDWANTSSIGLNDLDHQDMVSIFGKEAADAFEKAQYMVRRDAQEFGRVIPGSGSPTAQHLAEEKDTAALARQALERGPVETAIGHVLDMTTLGMRERARNQLSDHMMQGLDPTVSAQFREALVREIKRQANQKTATRAGGLFGSMQGARER